MKLDPLPAAVTLALTLMSGAVLNHRAGLDERIKLARAALDAGNQEAVETASAPPTIAIVHQPDAPVPDSAQRSVSSPALEKRLIEVLGLVEKVHNQNQNLRDQVAETNRDLMELQFRVDSHSQSFRPLNATQDPMAVPVGQAVPDGPGVLPPLEAP